MSVIGNPLIIGSTGGGGSVTVTDTTDTHGGTIRTITTSQDTPVIQASKSVTINSNGTTTVTPDTGMTTMGQVVVTTAVSGGWNIIPTDLPNDGATRFGYYIPQDAPSDRMTTCIRCTPSVSNGVVIDWGDGTTTTTNSTAATNYEHTYSSIPSNGYYIQKVTCTSGTVSFTGSSTATLFGDLSGSNYRAYNRTRIKWAVLGDDVASIGSYGMSSLDGLQEVNFLNDDTNIYAYAFYYDYSLRKINWPANENSVSSYTFYYCMSLLDIELPNNVYIGDYAFYWCAALSPKFKGSVYSIGGYAFYVCYNLVDIQLTDTFSGSTLNGRAFQNCRSIINLTIPSNITSIGAYALNGLSSLAMLRFSPNSPPTASSSTVISGLPEDCIILYPAESIDAYRSASNYPSDSTYIYVGFATYANGASLPSYDTATGNWELLWYSTIEDALAEQNRITVGNGNEIYCRGAQ